MSSAAKKAEGHVKDTVGNVQEFLGDKAGLPGQEAAGKKKQAEGQATVKKEAVKGECCGAKHRACGSGKAVIGALAGDKSEQNEGDAQKAKGKVQTKTETKL